MTLNLSEFVIRAKESRHHAVLLTCTRFVEEDGIGPGEFRKIVLELAGVALPEEETDGFWAKAGAHPDIVIVDRTRTTLRLEDIELISKRAYFSPVHATRRVFFIDRCERLNTNAANSLLKILEEPPTNVLFLLTARSAAGVLSTIASRCLKIAVHLERAAASPESAAFEESEVSTLLKFLGLPSGKVTSFAQTLQSGKAEKPAQALKDRIDFAEALAKKHTVPALLDGLAGVLSLGLTVAPEKIREMRILLGILRGWRTSLPFHPSSSLWLMKLFSAAQKIQNP